MKIYSLSKVPSSSWNRWYIEQAVRCVEQVMEKNEDWLLQALLDCNRDSIVFRDLRKQAWRGRDHLYIFMTEKDIQAAVAAELRKFDRCHVHVEVPIYGKTNRRKGKESEPYNLRPDIFLLSIRRKLKVRTREHHLEVSAVEIKYFGKSQGSWVRQRVEDDVWKLRRYLKRVSPKVDNGFFLCVDETGKAEAVLTKVFKQRRMRNQRLGYFVLVPKYVGEGRDYPMELQKYRPGLERGAVYVMENALSRLKRKHPKMLDGENIGCDRYGKWKSSAGPWFSFHRGNKEIGWAYLDWRFRDGRQIRPALIIWLRDERNHVGKPRAVKWDSSMQSYRFCDNNNLRRVYLLTSRSFACNLKKMDKFADELYRKVNRVVSKAQPFN